MSILKMIYYGLLGANLTALVFHIKHLSRRHLLFLPIILFALSTQLIAEVLRARGIPYYFLFHIYIPVEYAMLGMYYSFIFSAKASRAGLLVSAIGLLVFCIVYYYKGAAINLPDYTHFVIESVLVSICVVCFFIGIFRSEETVNLSRSADFWINSGNLFFYAGCIFVMGLHYSIRLRNPDLANQLLIINNYLNLLLYLFYLIAFTWAAKKT